MRGRTVHVRFNGQTDAKPEEPVYQYDSGLIMVFEDVDLPASYQVHFGNSVTGKTVPMVGDENGVEIPDNVLTQSGRIYAWVYLHETENDGETVYTVSIPVTARGEIGDIEPTPAQQSALDTAIIALNAAVEEAESIAEGIPTAIDTALEEAKASGEFDGEDGYSPTVEVEDITGGHRVTITDKDGAHIFDVMDGSGGGSAVSPTANVTKSGDTATITITDVHGTTTASISDGHDGQDGDDGVSPTIEASAIIGGHRLTITDAAGTSTVDVMDGTNGQDGDDGYSPTASVSKSGTTATITVTDKNGTTTATVSDGTNGTDGNDGNDGVTFTPSVASDGTISWTNDGGRQNPSSVNIKGPQGDPGEDYVLTAQDKADIAALVGATEETVSGTTPSIVAEANHRYICGQVSTISFTPSVTGICDVVFSCGSTAAVLTVPNTVKWPAWFDPTDLDANTVYELNVMDGVYGAVTTWAS